MPIKIVCASCSNTIYNSNTVAPLSVIVNRFHGKCPKCEHELSLKPISMSVNGSLVDMQEAEIKLEAKTGK